MKTYEALIIRLRAEYMEMPGLRLKPAQVQRLCGIESRICQLVLESLVDERFLRVSSDGHYARLTDGHIARPHLAKAGCGTADDRAAAAS